MQDFVYGEDFCPFIEEPTRSEIRRYHPGFFSISCVAIAVENLTRRRRRNNCDASTYQSNNFGVSRKRFKPSTPGSRTDRQTNRQKHYLHNETQTENRETYAGDTRPRNLYHKFVQQTANLHDKFDASSSSFFLAKQQLTDQTLHGSFHVPDSFCRGIELHVLNCVQET